jgi:hypothetical protein
MTDAPEYRPSWVGDGGDDSGDCAEKMKNCHRSDGVYLVGDAVCETKYVDRALYETRYVDRGLCETKYVDRALYVTRYDLWSADH